METKTIPFDHGTLIFEGGILIVQAKEGVSLNKDDLDVLVQYITEITTEKVPLLVDHASAHSVSFAFLVGAKEILQKHIAAIAFVTTDMTVISSIRSHVEAGHYIPEGTLIRIFPEKDEALSWLSGHISGHP